MSARDKLAAALTEYDAALRHGLSGNHDAGFFRAILARHGLAVLPAGDGKAEAARAQAVAGDGAMKQMEDGR